MSVWGKIIGGMAGFSMGGPLGAVLGAVVGHAIDKRYEQGESETPPWVTEEPVNEQDRQIAFTLAVIALSAKMAKADGVVTRAEIDAFKRLFQIPPQDMKKVGAMFDQARQTSAGYEPYAEQIARLFQDTPVVLEELLHALFEIGKADGELHPSEIDFIARIAQIFGFSQGHFETIYARATAGGHASSSTSGVNDPYAVLGLKPDVTDQEVKDMWRKLTRENHPDVLMAKGMPPELVENANKTMAAINAAYEQIKKMRGFK